MQLLLRAPQLLQLDGEDEAEPPAAPHWRFSLTHPSITLRRAGGEGDLAVLVSVMRLGISHGHGPPGDAPEQLLLRYYEPANVGAVGVAPSPASERERMPQFHVEYHCPADPHKAPKLRLALYRPEIVLLPGPVVEFYNHIVRLSRLLLAADPALGTPAAHRPAVEPASPSKRRGGGAAAVAAVAARGGGGRPVEVTIEMRKPRISFVEPGDGSAGSAKAVVQGTIVAHGRLGRDVESGDPESGCGDADGGSPRNGAGTDGCDDGLRITDVSLASAEMFVSEDGR
jgi:hypothetical protein